MIWVVLLALCQTPTEVQHTINYGVEYSRQYVWVELPNKNRTCVPIINGILPEIICRKDGSLVLDYSSGIAYRPEIYENVIRYQVPQKVPVKPPCRLPKREPAVDLTPSTPEPSRITKKVKDGKMMRPSEVPDPVQEVKPKY